MSCATSPGVQVAPPDGAAETLVADEDGPLDPKQAQASLERIEKEGKTDLLRHHLQHVEGAIDAPVVLGNEARLLIDGPRTHAAMFEAISQARHTVNLESYILDASEPGQRLARLLASKTAQGVKVNVMFDSVGSLGTPVEYFEQLKAAGVSVCEFNPVNPLKPKKGLSINNRDHRKLLIVDGRIAFTGGINISGTYSAGSFGSRRKRASREEGWRDTHVQVSGPIAAQFQRLFMQGWTRWCQPIVQSDQYFPGQEREGDMAMRLVAADPQQKRSELYVAILSAIGYARARVWLTYGYFVPDRATIEALCGAARRGVDVRLALPGFSDFWAPFHAGRSHYSTLFEAGVRIYERRDALLHAKTAVIDGVWSSVGSTNLDWRSYVHNYEADLIVYDRAFARQMEELFVIDVKASQRVREQEWRKRGFATRFKEWFARRWEYLL